MSNPESVARATEVSLSEAQCEAPESWTLSNLTITFHPAENRWQIEFKCREGKIKTSAFSEAELCAVLSAIGTKKLWPRTESIDEALLRGLKITKIPTMFAWGGEHSQNSFRHPLPALKLSVKPSTKLSVSALASLTLEDLFK